MQCRICGAEGYEGAIVGQIIKVKLHLDKGCQALCDLCAEQTPEKIGKHRFDLAYWGENYQDVPTSIRKEFYDDYRTSTHSFEEYVIATKSDCVKEYYE
jgi:hypothetical protein